MERFAEAPPQALICPICAAVLREPVLCGARAHALCTACALERGSCPACDDDTTIDVETLLATPPVGRKLARALKRLHIACDYAPLGCAELVPVGQLRSHTDACPLACKACAAPGCVQRARLKCKRCRAARYCSPQCQRCHWFVGHRLVCSSPGKLVELALIHALTAALALIPFYQLLEPSPASLLSADLVENCPFARAELTRNVGDRVLMRLSLPLLVLPLLQRGLMLYVALGVRLPTPSACALLWQELSTRLHVSPLACMLIGPSAKLCRTVLGSLSHGLGPGLLPLLGADWLVEQLLISLPEMVITLKALAGARYLGMCLARLWCMRGRSAPLTAAAAAAAAEREERLISACATIAELACACSLLIRTRIISEMVLLGYAATALWRYCLAPLWRAARRLLLLLGDIVIDFFVDLMLLLILALGNLN